LVGLLSVGLAVFAKVTPAQENNQPDYEAGYAAYKTDAGPIPIIEIERGYQANYTCQQVEIRQCFVKGFR
jgi:hypothetical protein